MPLPAPTVERRLVHTRTIVCAGHVRADDAWDIDGSITDVKSEDYENGDRGRVPPGEPIHAMSIRLTLDNDLTIKDAAAVVDHAPYTLCGAVAPDFQKLIGLGLAKGFKRSASERLGGTQGCIHLVDLLGPMATTAYQTATFRLNRALPDEAKGGALTRPLFLGTCHTWATDSPIVKRELPAFYTGE